MRVHARRADRDAAIAHVKDVALNGGDHDVLRHELKMRQSPLHFLEIARGHRFISLVTQPHLLGVGNGHGVSLSRFVRYYRSMMRVFNLNFALDWLFSLFDCDGLFSNLHVAPFAVVAILPWIIRVQLFFKNVRRIRPASSHRN